jgi:hypothetical protein
MIDFAREFCLLSLIPNNPAWTHNIIELEWDERPLQSGAWGGDVVMQMLGKTKKKSKSIRERISAEIKSMKAMHSCGFHHLDIKEGNFQGGKVIQNS